MYYNKNIDKQKLYSLAFRKLKKIYPNRMISNRTIHIIIMHYNYLLYVLCIKHVLHTTQATYARLVKLI